MAPKKATQSESFLTITSLNRPNTMLGLIASISMPPPYTIYDRSHKKLRARLREVDPASPAWQGIVAELQYRAARRLEWLTYAITAFTIVVAFLTAYLCYDAYLKSKSNAKEQHSPTEQSAADQSIPRT